MEGGEGTRGAGAVRGGNITLKDSGAAGGVNVGGEPGSAKHPGLLPPTPPIPPKPSLLQPCRCLHPAAPGHPAGAAPRLRCPAARRPPVRGLHASAAAVFTFASLT